MSRHDDITRHLQSMDPADPDDVNQLWKLVYDRLHELARTQRHRAGHQPTLNTTSLVHECFLKLRDAEGIDWQHRGHFYGVATNAMRQIVIDYARARTRQKRGSGAPVISFEDAEAFLPSEDQAHELIDLYEALEQYGRAKPRAEQIVEHLMVGLTHEEAAEVLNISAKTVQRDLRTFKAWYNNNKASNSLMPASAGV